MRNRLKYILYSLAVILLMTACTDNTLIDTIGDVEIADGELVMFTTKVPNVGTTRAAKDDWQTEIGNYKPVNHLYSLKVEMYKQGDNTPFGSAIYKPAQYNESFDKNTVNGTNGAINHDGTLALKEDGSNAPLYWQDNVNRWGFKATAGTETLSNLQNSQTNWLAQDRLEGYSYLPIWVNDDEDGHPSDDINAINYRTNKEWYRDNKTARELSGLMIAEGSNGEEYKKVPLYMQHKRAWVTLILRAGEGVSREALAFATSGQNISTTIYSYGDPANPLGVDRPWASSATVDYVADANGPAANGVSTTRYDAIVEPYNFAEHKEAKIASISLSSQKFSFSADCDLRGSEEDHASQKYKDWLDAYDLKAGRHLTIVATLSRESRKILITAWVEDWTEIVAQTICDDYGRNGDPILINSTDQLKAFLESEDKNQAGNVGLIVPNALILDGINWDGSSYNLKAALNLAGATLSVDKQFVNSIDRTGSILNGEIKVKDGFNAPTAIANTNEGTIERVKVTTESETTTARASVAGLVGINHGVIYLCSSALPVYGNPGTLGTSEPYYVGGIAAQSVYKEAGVRPVIESCTVSARVDGNANVTGGGGIAGIVQGKVSNNTFEYGITLLQDSKFKNIIADISFANNLGLTEHSNNSWPTTATYEVGTATFTNKNTTDNYHAVIDSQEELKKLLESQYNLKDQKYRVANSFDVKKESWIWGNDVLRDDYFATNSSGTYASGTVKFNLNGNGKTITLTATGEHATMLFGSIIGEVYDLNLYLAKPIVAARIMDNNNSDVDTNTDAIAAFAYAVTGTGTLHGTISNITLKAANDAYIQASTPGGLAVWASHGGVITNCASNVPIKMNLTPNAGTDSRRYAGGIVACAQIATISQCKYYSSEETAISWVDNINKTCQKDNCRYGGIIGGTSEISGTSSSDEVPSVEISDCYSWWTLPTFTEDVTAENRPKMGGITGSTVYHTSDQRVFSAMKEGNAGNWWAATTGAGYMASGVTEDDAIGRKNALQPNKPAGW